MNKITKWAKWVILALILGEVSSAWAISLHEAALNGDLDVVQQLLDSGQAINALDSYQRTALQVASGKGHAGVVKELLNRGAGTDNEDETGLTALMVAVQGGHEEIVRGFARPQSKFYDTRYRWI